MEVQHPVFDFLRGDGVYQNEGGQRSENKFFDGFISMRWVPLDYF